MILYQSEWIGNKWASVEIDSYEDEDFLKVLLVLCTEFSQPVPVIVDILDGYVADLIIENSRVTLMLDNWTFSVAAEKVSIRDRIFKALEAAIF